MFNVYAHEQKQKIAHVELSTDSKRHRIQVKRNQNKEILHSRYKNRVDKFISRIAQNPKPHGNPFNDSFYSEGPDDSKSTDTRNIKSNRHSVDLIKLHDHTDQTIDTKLDLSQF